MKREILAVTAATAGLVCTASAAVIVPVGVTAPGTFNATNRPAVNMINSSDFDDVTLTSGTASDGGNWTSEFLPSPSNDATSGNIPGSSPIAPYTLTFDLGANYNLDQVLIWNWNFPNNRAAGVKTLEILAASTIGGATISLGTVNPAMGPGTINYAGEAFSVTASDVREVKFVITEGWGWGNTGADTLIGISEVRFDGTPVPEPSAMALLGLGGLALVRRKRRA